MFRGLCFNGFIFVVLCLISFNSFSQEKFKNVVKLNIVPLVVSEFAVEFERGITDRISLNGGIGFMPERSLPFKSLIAKEVGSSSIIDASRMGVFAFSVEGRYYLKKKEHHLQGFYVGPFVKYGHYKLNTSVDYAVSKSIQGSLPLLGDFNTFTAGAAVGAQWVLSRQLVLDWRIIGFSYGIANGNLLGKKDISDEAKKEVLDKLHLLADDLPVLGLKPEITNQGVRTKIDGPWYGIRTALSIGYRF